MFEWATPSHQDVAHPTPSHVDEPLPPHQGPAAPAATHPAAPGDIFHAFGHWLDDFGLGSDGATWTKTTPPGSDGTSHTTTVTAGGSGVGIDKSKTTTTGDSTTTTNGGVSINPGDGSVTLSGGTTTNGTGTSGSVTVGPGSVSGSGSVQVGPVSAGLTFGVSHTDVASTVVQGDQTSQVSDVLGGQDYIAATRSDEQKLGGNLAVKAVGLSADTTSNSTVQVFQALPASWSTMSPDERVAYQAKVAQQQQAALGTVNGLGDLQLDQIQDGTGIRCRTANGWDAGAGINYGAVSLSMGGGQTSASEVTLAKTNGKFEVSLVREDGCNMTMGAGIAGFGFTSGETNDDSHQVKFQVDPTNPQAMAALKTFMQTGLLPGADMLTDKDGQAAASRFNSAKAQVDQLNAQIQQLQAPMAQTGAAPDPGLAQLYAQLDIAQQSLATNRSYLNDRWQAQYGSQVGAGPMAGVQTEEVTDTNVKTTTGGFTTPLGDVSVPTETRTWVHRQYQGTGGTPQDQFKFDDQYMGTEQQVGTDTDPNHVVLSMFTNTVLNNDNAPTIKNIRNSDMPGYVVDGMVNHQVGDLDTHGQVNVALDAQQLNMITSSLNDMNNPQSQKMWSDFGLRTSQFMAGQDFTLKTGDQMKDIASTMGGNQARQDWYNDLWARDPNDPLRKGLASFGADPGAAEQAAAARFAAVRTPADFQKLSAEQQQLFVSVLESTSGPVHDLTGQRNSYEALAACALLHDNAAPAGDAALRAQSMAKLFEQANDQGKNENTDAVFEFVRFTDRFAEDPARYAAIQQGMSFNWKQAAVDTAATQSEQQIGAQMAADFHSKDDAFKGWDFGGGGKRAMVDMMEAANKQGGAEEVQRIVAASGISPGDLIARVADDPVRQHMVADMLTEAGYKLDGIPLAYQCTP